MQQRELNVAAQIAGRVGACHEMAVCEPGLTNMKSGPLGRGTQSFDGVLNQGQLIAGSPAGIPACLPKLMVCSGDGGINFLKGQR